MRRRTLLIGPAVFVALTLGLTLVVSAVLAHAWSDEGLPTTRLLRASLIYVAVVGWQPLLALFIVRRLVDSTFVSLDAQGAPPRFTWLSLALPIALLGGAALIDLALGTSRVHAAGGPIEVSVTDAVLALCTFGGVLAVLWVQATVEELAWRGYVLSRLMQAFGAWAGLFVHGLLWGACYAPVLVVRGGPPVGGFLVTCGLLGIILGWLRLASGSIATSAACNAVLTVCAGLPLVLQGASPRFSALFGPAGWIPMGAVVMVIVAWPRLRAAISAPTARFSDHLN